mmetsp:Transcript_31903/g.88185  ORF Transcript_31903/g.88185 Transcript_31903/m.88185 type:complete len:183 (+) Transcript_31903:671-1219(+)
MAVYFQGTFKLKAMEHNSDKSLHVRERAYIAFQQVPGARVAPSTQTFADCDYESCMLQSDFCLVPRGDTPTTARLFNAIAAGCIPLIVADHISLPFSDVLKWDKFSVQLPESELANASAISSIVNMSADKFAELHRNLLDVADSFLYAKGVPSSFEAGALIHHVLLAACNAVEGGPKHRNNL